VRTRDRLYPSILAPRSLSVFDTIFDCEDGCVPTISRSVANADGPTVHERRRRDFSAALSFLARVGEVCERSGLRPVSLDELLDNPDSFNLGPKRKISAKVSESLAET